VGVPRNCGSQLGQHALLRRGSHQPLENGGAPLDPAISGHDRVGAREKDKLENYVHNGICLGIPNARFSIGPKPSKALTLVEGQRILAIDWYACYQSLADGKDCEPPQ
jgi:hypothetical protein